MDLLFARRIRVAFGLLLVSLGLLVACSEQTERDAVHILKVDTSVGPILDRYIDRGIDRAEDSEAKLVVIELDTPGGLDSSMRDIVQRIESADVPIAIYVYPPGGRAASAGTFITMAGHLAVMAPNTSIGAASAINSDGSDIEGTLGRKVEEDAVAFIRGIALLRERNADWAESAVRDAEAVNQAEAVELDVVDYVANDLDDLLAQAEGRTFDLKPGQPVTLRGLPEAPRVTTEMTVWERFLDIIADPTIASILIAVGFFAIIAEVMNPGMFLPGIVGVVSLMLGFLAFGVLPVETTGLILMLLGIVLIAAELFVPGGLLGLGGLVALALGGIIAFRDTPAELRPPLWLVAILVFVVGGMFVSMAAAVARLRNLNVTTGSAAMLGKLAVVRTPLTPEGYVFVQGERWRAHLARGTAHEGDRVRIVGADGLRLQVEPIESEEKPT
ncbi:MAG: nodulation protein NfeD [Dehalococcoidia bacterium]|nr:nodulation protein NfeD [Dehalococcoidia bacterium]